MDASMELDAMAEMSKELDDLGNLFEFGDIDLNNIPDSGNFGDTMQSNLQVDASLQSLTDLPMMASMSAQDFGDGSQYNLLQDVEQQRYPPRHDSGTLPGNSYSNEPVFQTSGQQQHDVLPQNFQYQPQIGFQHGQYIPATPNSYEMHGDSSHPFMQRHMHMDPLQRAIMEQRFSTGKDHAIAFTPMASPAVTPQFGMLPEFTTPGAYFSPLTSPMLHAQTQLTPAHLLQQQQHRSYIANPSTASSSNANSPADATSNVQLLDNMATSVANGAKPRKSKRKIATPRSAAMIAKAKQSPAQTAQKRKSAAAPFDTPHSEPDAVSTTPAISQSASVTQPLTQQHDSSEGGSISPEALSESLMGPPPRPSTSLHASPALKGQQKTGNSAMSGAAATPKTVLSTRATRQYSNEQNRIAGTGQIASDLDGIDDLSLPEAAKPDPPKPSLTQIITNTSDQSFGTNAARVSSRKTPKLGPLSTPSSARPGSTLPSPVVACSPRTATTPLAFAKADRDSKHMKRRSTTSATNSKLVSPALVPKISPSIQPLLPEGSKPCSHPTQYIHAVLTLSTAPLNSANQALLLASKSNYQNLMEGTHLPGVSYPDHLSTGLTSKRTSHKVAEQGRRNRMNDAIKEMQTIVPKPAKFKSSPSTNNSNNNNNNNEPDPDADATSPGDTNTTDGKKDSKEDAAQKSNNSKAATVELANEYIRRIQQESAAQAVALAEVKRENEALKKRLAERESGSGSGSGSGGSVGRASPSRSTGTGSLSSSGSVEA